MVISVLVCSLVRIYDFFVFCTARYVNTRDRRVVAWVEGSTDMGVPVGIMLFDRPQTFCSIGCTFTPKDASKREDEQL